MFLLYHVIRPLNELLEKVLILLVDAVHYILVHKVAIQILCFFIIILSPPFLFLVDNLKSVERTSGLLLLEVTPGLLLRLWLILPSCVTNIDILLPFVLELKLQISVVLFVCFSRHT